MTEQTLARLRELLLNEFTESELEQLCSDIGLRYADLRGTGTFGKTRELLESARAQDKLRQLQNRIREVRPAAFAAAGLGPTAADASMPTTSPASSAPRDTAAMPARPIGGVAPTDTPPPSAIRERTESAPLTPARLLPIVAIVLVVILCVAAAASLIMNRPGTPAATGATATANVTSGTSVGTAAINQVPTQPVPADATAGAVAGVAGDGTEVAATVAAEGTAAATAATTPTPEMSPTAAPSATPAATATLDPTAAAGQSHPAAVAIRDLNQQLPEFYLGKLTATDLQKYWTGPAWTSVVSFGTTKLPRVMRVPAAQRGNLDVTYRYEQLPTLQSERGTNAVVVAREYWRYANAANAIEICETRQYTYNLVSDGGQFKVREFTSRLLQSGCN